MSSKWQHVELTDYCPHCNDFSMGLDEKTGMCECIKCGLKMKKAFHLRYWDKALTKEEIERLYDVGGMRR